MDIPQWQYAVVTFANPKFGSESNIEASLNDYGRAGWELIVMTTTVKAVVNMTGNDLVAVFKRRSSDPADLAHMPGQTLPEGGGGWL